MGLRSVSAGSSRAFRLGHLVTTANAIQIKAGALTAWLNDEATNPAWQAHGARSKRGERFCLDRNHEIHSFEPMQSEANPQILLHSYHTGKKHDILSSYINKLDKYKDLEWVIRSSRFDEAEDADDSFDVMRRRMTGGS